MGIIIVLVYVVFKISRGRLPKSLTKIFGSLKDKLMFNSVLRYLLQQFLKLSTTVMLNFYNVIMATVSTWSLLLSVPSLLLLCGFTAFNYFFIQNHLADLSSLKFKDRYGSLYARVETHNHKEASKYSFLFCIKRLSCAFIIGLCQHSVVLQVFL